MEYSHLLNCKQKICKVNILLYNLKIINNILYHQYIASKRNIILKK